VIDVPYLRQKWLLGIDDPSDFLLESADDHRVSHNHGEGMVKLHLFINVFEIIFVE